MNKLAKSFLIVLLLFLALSLLFSAIGSKSLETKEVSFSEAIQSLKEQEVTKIVIHPSKINIFLQDDNVLITERELNVSFIETLQNFGFSSEEIAALNIEIEGDGASAIFFTMILPILIPILLIGFLLFYSLRRANQGAMQIFSFSRSNIKLFSPSKDGITFKDVAGLKESKEELKEIVEFLKTPKKFHDLGAKIPRGVLLMGPPGSGKTLLARAVAGEAKVPFFHISGSEFVEMFVGVGASVSHNTNILIKTKNSTKLLSIGEFVNQFYKKDEEGLKKIEDTQTLGVDLRGKRFFRSSNWKNVKAVYRHKVKEIYEIQYLGGKIKTTGDHSVFVREKNYIRSKQAKDLTPGDILVNLPFKVRGAFIPAIGTTHQVRSHQFEDSKKEKLVVWREDESLLESYQFVLANENKISQYSLARQVGVSQSAISDWQRHLHLPRGLSLLVSKSKLKIPQEVEITPDLMRLLGYYTAEGRKTDYYLQFVFGSHEKSLHQDCISLMKNIFNLNPHLAYTPDNTLRITYSSKVLADFFEKHCGNGSHNKHIPQFLWDLPKEYFIEFLQGYANGDGYTSKEGKLIISSVSKQLILEIIWLSAMHGLQTGFRKAKTIGGRILKKKPLPESDYYLIIFGKTSHPFQSPEEFSYQFKKPIIKEIKKITYNNYVYDLCGCENEAFFGGDKPILFHNSRVRDTFATAKKAAPSILFIDEIDAIGRVRGAGIGGGHDEREQTLNQILVEMDGFDRDTKTIVIAATNRPDVLDPALLRPGRFDRRVVLDLPSINDREKILEIHVKGKSLAPLVNLREIAERTPGFSGADLANLTNEAAILAARRDQKNITQKELLDSIEKVILGPERRSRVLTKKEKEITAYHEAGHALISALLPNTASVRKISIITRGRAAGYTMRMPTEEKYMKTRSEFLDDVCALLGGYVAEEIKFKEISTGASNDLKEATDIARGIVTKYGMSKKMGPISFDREEGLVFLGRDISTERQYSEETAAKIDKEVTGILKKCYNDTKVLLKKNIDKLERVTKELIEKETLEKEEFEKLVK